jgi:glycosyltransferase involved in cell wall biosynthesis
MTDISLVIPVYNEEESLLPLMAWIDEVMKQFTKTYEVVFIDDGSSDTSWEVIKQLQSKHPDIIKGIKFRRNYGKSAALNVGFKKAEGSVVITMDADMQDSPDEIPLLYNQIYDEGLDMISGWKKKRHDPISKTLPSKLFNAVARKVSGIQLHDFNCGLKAYKNEVVKEVNLYGDMHRWIPVLAKWEGYSKIGEKVVEHRQREFGVSKFGAKRLISGFLDLLTIFFVGKFNKRPMHFFGTWGLIFLFAGFVILSYLSIAKLIYNQSGIQERPLFFFGILILIVGSQLFLTGFLAELVINNRAKESNYNIEQTI